MTEGDKTMLGSPATVTAPMAVKCRPQMAAASSAGAIHSALRRSSSCHASSAAEASTTPITIAASDEGLVPDEDGGIMRACMPAKCMRAMPPPMTAPPATAIGRPPRAEMAKPASATTAAINSDAIVKAAS